MLSRKILAAFITSLVCYFIVPLFFNDYQNSYLLIGLGVSIVTVPALFILGIITSLIIEVKNHKRNMISGYFIHLICAIVYSIVIFFFIQNSQTFDISLILIYLSIATLYVTIFFISDSLIKFKERSAI